MATLKILIVGLGQIGALYDIVGGSSALPLTHLRAVLENRGFEIKGLVDPDQDARQLVQSETGLSSDVFYDCPQAIPKQNFDVVVFACPPEGRCESLLEVIEFQPKVVVFEKPLVKNLDVAIQIQKICEQNEITAIVNFHRRYDQDHNKFSEALPQENPNKIIFHYTKGLWNYGSHGIDLIQNWFGAIQSAQGFSASDDNDPLVDGVLTLESGTNVHFISHQGQYDMFDFEVFYEDSKYSLQDGGIRKTRRMMQQNLHHKGYNHLGIEENVIEASKVYGLNELYEDVVRACADPAYILKGCSLDEAISGIKIIIQLIESAGQ